MKIYLTRSCFLLDTFAGFSSKKTIDNRMKNIRGNIGELIDELD